MNWKWSKFSHNSQTWFTLVQVCVIKRIVYILLFLGLAWSWFMLEPWFLWMVEKKTFFFFFLMITIFTLHCFIWSTLFSKCVIWLRWIWELRAPFQTLITCLLFSYFAKREMSKNWFGVFLCSCIGLMQMAIRKWSNTCLREFEIFVLLPFVI